VPLIERFKALKELFYIYKRECRLKELSTTYEKMREVFNEIQKSEGSIAKSIQTQMEAATTLQNYFTFNWTQCVKELREAMALTD